MVNKMIVKVLGEGRCGNEKFPNVLILAYQTTLLSMDKEGSKRDETQTTHLV